MKRVAEAHGSAAHPAPFVFMQDGAPTHRSKKTVAYLTEEEKFFLDSFAVATKLTQFEPLGLRYLVLGLSGRL